MIITITTNNKVKARGYFLPAREYSCVQDWNTEDYRLMDDKTTHFVAKYNYKSAVRSGWIKEENNG